ncbi:MAG: TolC family protein, partial [Acidobacteriota bacterium]
RLAVLVGEAPSAVEGELASLAPRPLADELVPAGLPSELLLRRPDLRAAERQLAAASAEIGVAVARRFPRVTLGGAGGWAGRGFGDLFAAASGTWNLGVAVSWPIFQGGRLRAGVHAAEARHAAAEAAYRLAVLRALEDVETSLVAYGESQVARRERRTAAHAAEHAARLARRLYADGLADFETLFAAEREAAEAQEGLATVETTVGVRLVGLYKALGGGWQVFEPLASASAPGSAGAELMAD